jgi:hypothetical protein
MATRARMTLTVTSTRGATQLTITSVGRYVSADMNKYSIYLPSEPLQPTSSQAAFWLSILAIASAYITANP